jgi:replicative DNA helicase
LAAAPAKMPDLVWELPASALAELLQTLFSRLGRIFQAGVRPQIELPLPSEELARDVQHALTRLGVLSSLGLGQDGERWRVEIDCPQAVAEYQRQIGWPEGHPVPVAALAGRAKREPLPTGTWAFGVDPRRLHRVASADLHWDPIVQIDAIGAHQVYDLSVPDGENFVAEDVLVHNTSFVMNAVQNASTQHKVPALVFSLEMSKESLCERLLCSQARVDSTKLRGGFLETRDWVQITKAASEIAEAPIHIDDSGSPTLLEIRAKARRWRADTNLFRSPDQLGLLVIDYLQLVQGRASRDDNRQREISEISRGLKALAKELRVPVVALSQLNRSLESRADKRPMLSDLRESGAIEQDADVIAFIYRDEVYSKDQCKEEDKGVAEIIIGKQRNGPTGTARLTFLNTFTRFENLAESRDD